MNNTKLSLADFKAKAEKVEKNELLEKVQGGAWDDCHGFWGEWKKGYDKMFDDNIFAQ